MLGSHWNQLDPTLPSAHFYRPIDSLSVNTWLMPLVSVWTFIFNDTSLDVDGSLWEDGIKAPP